MIGRAIVLLWCFCCVTHFRVPGAIRPYGLKKLFSILPSKYIDKRLTVQRVRIGLFHTATNNLHKPTNQSSPKPFIHSIIQSL